MKVDAPDRATILSEVKRHHQLAARAKEQD
jgi:hypothetical protein